VPLDSPPNGGRMLQHVVDRPQAQISAPITRRNVALFTRATRGSAHRRSARLERSGPYALLIPRVQEVFRYERVSRTERVSDTLFPRQPPTPPPTPRANAVRHLFGSRATLLADDADRK